MASMTFETGRMGSERANPSRRSGTVAPLSDVLMRGFVGVLPSKAEALALELQETMAAVRGAIANGQPTSLSALLKCVRVAATLVASDQKSLSVREGSHEEPNDFDTDVVPTDRYSPPADDFDTDVYCPDQ